MRIIAGLYKGRKLKRPPYNISPTKDNIKETIFNILRNKTKDALVLDLFSGSGALGFEALSRGAKKVILVDKIIVTINKNLFILNLNSNKNIDVFKQDAFYFIKKMSKKGLKFNLIFLDPPYYKSMAKKSLHMLSSYDILHPGGWVIAEYHRHDNLPQVIGKLEVIRNFHIGQTSVSIYQKRS